MNTKYIGLDIDSKKTVACVVQQGQKDRYTTFQSNPPQMQQYLQQERQDGSVVHLMNLLEELKLLMILRAMLRTGELFNEELVSAEKAGNACLRKCKHGTRIRGWFLPDTSREAAQRLMRTSPLCRPPTISATDR